MKILSPRTLYKSSFKTDITIVVGLVFRFQTFWPRFYIVVIGIAFFITLHLIFPIFTWIFISNFYLDFYFLFLFGHLLSFFYLDFYFHFQFGLFYLEFSFSIRVSIPFNFFFTPIAVTFWISSKFLSINISQGRNRRVWK